MAPAILVTSATARVPSRLAPEPVAEPDLALPQPPDGQPADVGVGVQVGDQGTGAGAQARRPAAGWWPRSSPAAGPGRRPGRPAGARPARLRALAYRIGKPIWCSSASRSRTAPRSRGRPRPAGRRPGRPVHAPTTGSRRARALPSTYRVSGSGPSLASTSSRTRGPSQGALDLAAEVGVPGCRARDPQPAELHRRLLGQEVMLLSRSSSIESSTGRRPPGCPEHPRLAQHGVHRRCLPMVDMGHDGNVSGHDGAQGTTKFLSATEVGTRFPS